MNWANKYRPKSFSTFYGQEKTVSEVKALLESDDAPQTWLITGAKGNGKTTLARLMARKILGVSVKDDIKQHDDYEEINVGAERSKERMEEITNSMRFKPKKADKKVYVLDECHQLLGAASSTLLKPLEEPLAHCVFIMATNEPEKLLNTLKDRATQANLPVLSNDSLAQIITRIGTKEELKFCTEEFALKLAQQFHGETRKAIETLQKLSVSNKDGKIAEADFVKKIEESLDSDYVLAGKYLVALYTKEKATTCQLSQQFSDANALVRNILDLNNYLLEKLTQVPTWPSVVRKALYNSVKAYINIDNIANTQSILLQLKNHLLTDIAVNAKQLMLFYTTSIILAQTRLPVKDK